MDLPGEWAESPEPQIHHEEGLAARLRGAGRPMTLPPRRSPRRIRGCTIQLHGLQVLGVLAGLGLGLRFRQGATQTLKFMHLPPRPPPPRPLKALTTLRSNIKNPTLPRLRTATCWIQG